MDTKRLITAVLAGLAFIVLYYTVLLPFLDRRMHYDPSAVATSGPVPADTQPASTAPSSQPISESPSTQAVAAATLPTSAPSLIADASKAQVVPATQPAPNPVPSVLGSARPQDSAFAMQLQVEPLGAGLGSVVLNDFRRTARGTDPYLFETPLPNRLDTEPLGSRSVTVNGATYDLAGVQWSLVASTATTATYGADLVQGGQKLLGLRKTYAVLPRSDASKGYEARVEYEFENPTGAAQVIRAAFNGPTLPPPETNRPPDRQVVAGYTVDKTSITVESHPIEEFKPDKNNGEFDLTKDSAGHPARWAGAVSNYFAAIVLPLEMRANAKQGDANYIRSIIAHGVNIDKDVPADDHTAYLTFETIDIKLHPHASAQLPMSVFFGPKARKTDTLGTILESSYYTSYPRAFEALTTIRSSMCGMSFCTFGWLADAIQWLLGAIHYVVRDWGLAIIGLVAIVRVLLHPITRQSQISMSRMSKMGPEMERLRKKYGDDKDALNKAMVEFHREQGLGPYLGCLPMFLQMPIWIALYGVLQSTFQLRQAPFLGHWTWIRDLAQPDMLIPFSHPVKFLFLDIHGFNLLPIFLSAAMVAQQRFMPKPVAATPEQIQQQKMMQWLSPVMFLFFFYNLPSGLNLYIFTSTAVGVIESKIIRDHLKQREEAEKAGRVFVETKATRASRRGGLAQPEEPPKRRGPLGWLGARWARLLEQAESVRQDQQRRDGKKRF